MILTRCPACQKVFRVRPEHLRAHQGAVRCGHCFSPFNALEHLLEDLPGTETGATGASAPPPPQAGSVEPPRAGSPTAAENRPTTPEAPPPEPATPPAPTDVTTTPPATPRSDIFVLEERSTAGDEEDHGASLRFEVPEMPEPPRTPSAAPPRSPAGERHGSTFDDLADRLEFGLPDSFLTPAPAAVRSARKPSGDAAPAGEGTEPPAAPSGRHPEPAAPAIGRTEQASPAPETPREPTAGPEFFELPGAPIPEAEPTLQPLDAWQGEPDYGAMTEPAPMEPLHGRSAPPELEAVDDTSAPHTPFIPDDAPPLEHLDAAYGPRPAPSSGRRWLWGLGIGVLLGTLTAQAAYVFREEITRQWPVLRPAYQAVCEELGCEVPLPRIAGAISIETSDLQSDPSQAGRFVLNALIRNRATHPQALPHLELTLTDERDRPLVRRVFTPPEWVPHSEPARGFLAGEDLAARLVFTAPGVDAAGYRVYVFYP